MSPMTLGLYLRISDDPLALRAGVERQRTDGTKLCAYRWPGEPVITYEDNDRSAYHGRRPDWERMLGDLRNGVITGVVAYNIDRLVRQPRELEVLIDMNVSRVLTAEGDLDLTTHDGQLQARILVAVAKKASDDTSRRVKRATMTRRETGKWVGGNMPYPYVQRQSVVGFRSTSALQVARTAARRLLDGYSLMAVRTWALSQDSSSPTTATGWRRAALSPAWAGLNSAGIRGQWEPVITGAEQAQLVQLLTAADRNTHSGSRSRQHWLSGLVSCATCETNMRLNKYPRMKHSDIRGYKCAKCGRMISRLPLEEQVERWLFRRAKDAASTVSTTPAETTPAVEREERLSELAALYVRGELSRAEWDAARAATPATAPSPSTPSFEPVLREAWSALTVAERHSSARRYLHAVRVGAASGSGNTYDEGRALPHWKA